MINTSVPLNFEMCIKICKNRVNYETAPTSLDMHLLEF